MTVVGSFSANVSGNVVVISTSGQGVWVSGSVSVSGNTTFEFGTSVFAPAMTQLNDLSGGVLLPSGSVFGFSIINLLGNSAVWLGGTGTMALESGKGGPLYGGGSIDFKLSNPNLVSAIATVSGQWVSVIGASK